VPDLQTSLTKGKAANWGLHVKDEAGAKPGGRHPADAERCEIEIPGRQETQASRLSLTMRTFYVRSQSPGMENYYKNMYGAKLVKGEPRYFSLPGGKLVFSSPPRH